MSTIGGDRGRAGGARLRKYRRVLPHLVLDRAVFASGQPIAVHVAEPIDELCDVALRLVHASGRTHAQTVVQIDPETRTIPLGKALNLPDGAYEIVATPPLGEFFSLTPVERRLPAVIVTSAFSEVPSGTYDERRKEALGAIAAGSRGFAATLARTVTGDDARAAEPAAPDGDPAVAVLLLLLAERSGALPTPELLRTLSASADAATFPRAVAGYLLTGRGAAQLGARIRRFGTHGFSLIDQPALEATIVALAALAECGRGWLAELAAAALDKLCFCLALGSAAGVFAPASLRPALSARTDGFAPLTRLFWGVGAYNDRTLPALLALALAHRYEVPAPLQHIALWGGQDVSIQVHRPDPAGPAVAVRIWRSGGAMLSSAGGFWQASLDPDIRVFSPAAGEVSHTDRTLTAHYAAGPQIGFPFWAFEETQVEACRVFGRMGDRCVELCTDRPISRPRENSAAALILAPDTTLVCRVASAADEHDVSGAVSVKAAAAPRLELRDAASVADNTHIESAFGAARLGDDAIEIRFGDEGLRLDFSP